MYQVVAEAMRDRCKRAHTAWRDHHSQRHERATGDRRALRAGAVTLRREALYVLQRVWGFMRERACRPLAHDQMCFHSRPVQHLQQSHTEDRSGRASDADNETRWLCLVHR
jgi:hypothetical protein